MSQEVPALPRGLVQWIPFLWSRVVFPGRSEHPTGVRWLSLLTLLILPAIFLYPTRSFLLLEPDEGRYAEIAREIVQNQQWIVPTLQGQPYLDKPPLFYWLVAISYQLFGTTDAVARLVPSVAVHLTILLLYLIGRRSLGERSAFWASLLLSFAPGFVGMGRLLILDGLLTLWITLASLSLFEAIRTGTLDLRWWYLGAVACGLGVLTKGPIALLLPLMPLVFNRWLTGSRIRIGKHWLGLFAMVLAVNLPWYIGIFLHQPIFLKYFFWEHNILRFFQPFDHLQPVWYYAPILLGGMMPMTLLLIPFIRHLISGDPEETQNRSPALGFYLLAAGWCIAFFSLSGAKLPTYILPAMPMLMLAFGGFLSRSKWRNSLLTKLSLGTTFLLLVATFYVALPWYANYRSPLRNREVVEKFCSDSSVPLFTYPRNCDSVAFYLERDNLITVRSKFTQHLIEAMLEHPRSVVIFTHRHSYEGFKHLLPPQLKIVEMHSFRKTDSEMTWIDKLIGDTPWGLCDLAVIERR
jgi:4-amino-4-deoxy-L-arabinose transferase-like glycosyltransferase